jgi:hypothetical protein
MYYPVLKLHQFYSRLQGACVLQDVSKGFAAKLVS